MYFPRPKMLSPIVHPTKCCDVHETEVYQVPHIHPTHTTVHHHKLFEHVHTCPNTVSHVSNVAHQHINCCPGPMPYLGGGPGMAPGMMAPGMAPEMGMLSPGMAPGMGMMCQRPYSY
ncbi:CotD family spore coat protein [Calidifontibacillus erzurumensis]|uniref:CotD family spore coat protein n=1 Tax=Calidifontibacillus erzurumensis TaxID=2741433 RepID=UPI0035B5375B